MSSPNHPTNFQPISVDLHQLPCVVGIYMADSATKQMKIYCSPSVLYGLPDEQKIPCLYWMCSVDQDMIIFPYHKIIYALM